MEPEDANQTQNQSQEDQAWESVPQESSPMDYLLDGNLPESIQPVADAEAAGVADRGLTEARLPEVQSPEIQLEDQFDSNYRYVMVAARRARQLQNGSPPLLATQSGKACRVAQDEIAAGLVKYIRTPRAESAAPRASGSLINTYSSYR